MIFVKFHHNNSLNYRVYSFSTIFLWLLYFSENTRDVYRLPSISLNIIVLFIDNSGYYDFLGFVT